MLQEIEDTLEDPNALISDVVRFVTGNEDFDLEKELRGFLDEVPEFDLKALEELDFNAVGYLPLIDPLGPYLFYPDHCYKGGASVFAMADSNSTEADEKSAEEEAFGEDQADMDGKGDANTPKRYSSPYIGFVKTGASIEDDVKD